MQNKKKWLFSLFKMIIGFLCVAIVGGISVAFVLSGLYRAMIEYNDISLIFICLIFFVIFAIFLYIGLKALLSYCAYDKHTLFVYSFLRCKKINFKDITFISHQRYESRNGNGDKWFLSYWDKTKNCEKTVKPQFPSGKSKSMHSFFAALKAVHPCKVSCYDYTENYEGVDDFLDIWQKADGYESSSFPFDGTVYKMFVMPFEMENDDISPLRNVLLYEEGVWNEDEEEAYEGVIGLSEKDKIELICVEEKSSDIKEFCEKWLLPEKASTKMCSLVEKADGYYKIFKNGEEFACEYDGVSAKYRVVKLGKKCALFSFHLEK